MKFNRESLLMYAITDRRWLHGKTLEQAVEEALQGGATFIQLREKDLEGEHLEQEALSVQKICQKHNVPFILDDNVALAKKINADGVHVGQHDMAADQVRRILGPDKIVGVSARTVEDALRAEREGASYLGVGAVFPTGSKNDASPVSRKTLKEICEAVSIPVIAIGGITAENVTELKGTGIAGVAVISAVFAQKDIRQAAEYLKKQTEKVVFE